MTKAQVIKETLRRLLIARQHREPGSVKSKEEDWLESILRSLMDIPEDKEILDDINTLKSL